MAFESLFPYLPLRQLASERSSKVQSKQHLLLALNGRPGDVYDEDAFRHFLAVERMRAQRSQRPFLLLLVSIRGSRIIDEVPGSVSPALFTGLGLCVREIDFVGWYRQGRVAGAVLPQGVGLHDRDASHRIVSRVNRILGEHLPSVAGRLRVRTVQLGARAR